MRLLIALTLGGASAGCGSDPSGVGKTVPVSGLVTVDGQPLALDTATVLFKPDGSKGNTLPFEPAGNLDSKGVYTLYTAGKKGAPPGRYKVVVAAMEPLNDVNARRAREIVRKSLINLKYVSEATSGIEIEVVEDPAPGAYDLKLSK